MPDDTRRFTNIYASKIGHTSRVAELCEIGGSVIGEHCSIQAFCFLPPGSFLEDFVFLGPRVTLCNVVNPRAGINRKSEIQGVTIRKGATVGAGAVILPGVEIGEYAFVGAGSVVTKDVAPYSLVVGNPARHVRFINKEAVW